MQCQNVIFSHNLRVWASPGHHGIQVPYRKGTGQQLEITPMDPHLQVHHDFSTPPVS